MWTIIMKKIRVHCSGNESMQAAIHLRMDPEISILIILRPPADRTSAEGHTGEEGGSYEGGEAGGRKVLNPYFEERGRGKFIGNRRENGVGERCSLSSTVGDERKEEGYKDTHFVLYSV